MAAGVMLFAGLEIAGDAADVGRPILADTSWISVGVVVHAARGENPRIEFRVQWSFDNATWAEGQPVDVVAAIAGTTPVAMVQRLAVKAPYWRLVAQVTGTDAAFQCSANALI